MTPPLRATDAYPLYLVYGEGDIKRVPEASAADLLRWRQELAANVLALARWTQHAPTCARAGTTAESCTCGLQEAWGAVEAHTEEGGWKLGRVERRRSTTSESGTVERQRDDLLNLMWRCHCAMEDGVPLPFNRWLMGDGPDMLVEDCKALRDAYDTVCEREQEARDAD